eukprot:TRINITY_DN4308_c0_g1_i1.p1 TRINITY_DN4308_c0_g1~~TRINITY_DN4308_c0_g1_i1.p1  ORF type:complete len:262 (-),score=48.48 TRINITY_DN4308_c0_g1_i1:170-955(-)
MAEALSFLASMGTNELLFKKSSSEDLVLFFPGDIQDFKDRMEGPFSEYCFERTIDILCAKFACNVLLIRAADVAGGMAVYGQFLGGSRGTAWQHLAELVVHLEQYCHCVFRHVVLCGFSKGGVVLNRLIFELPVLNDTALLGHNLLQRVVAIHWLDSGHHPKGAYPETASGCGVQDLIRIVKQRESEARKLSLFVHGSPRQLRTERNAYIKQELDNFMTAMAAACCPVTFQMLFAEKPASLKRHFQVLEAFEPHQEVFSSS